MVSLVQDLIGKISEDEFHIRWNSSSRIPRMHADELVKRAKRWPLMFKRARHEHGAAKALFKRSHIHHVSNSAIFCVQRTNHSARLADMPTHLERKRSSNPHPDKYITTGCLVPGQRNSKDRTENEERQ